MSTDCTIAGTSGPGQGTYFITGLIVILVHLLTYLSLN
jgi:hypothetical protein